MQFTSGEPLSFFQIVASLVRVVSHSEITSASVFDDYVNISLKMQHVQITHIALKYSYAIMSVKLH